MSKSRKIQTIITGTPATDGAGVKLVRLFGGEDMAKQFDPFLMMDGFDSINSSDYAKGFPWHPHRGIETITYLIKGNLEHRDSLGTVGVINDGDVQWMTAGSGIVHQEMPQDSDHMLGVQLWLNLPREHKMTRPKYGDILSQDIPVVEDSGISVRVISGKYRDTAGAFTGAYVEPTFLDVSLDSNTKWQLDTMAGHKYFIYIVSGSIHTDSQDISDKHVVLFTDGDSIQLTSGSEGARLLVLGGKPLREPIAWAGPVVMNTEAELHQAFLEIQDGSFIKNDNTSKST